MSSPHGLLTGYPFSSLSFEPASCCYSKASRLSPDSLPFNTIPVTGLTWAGLNAEETTVLGVPPGWLLRHLHRGRVLDPRKPLTYLKSAWLTRHCTNAELFFAFVAEGMKHQPPWPALQAQILLTLCCCYLHFLGCGLMRFPVLSPSFFFIISCFRRLLMSRNSSV
jgi:hypothetical protein